MKKPGKFELMKMRYQAQKLAESEAAEGLSPRDVQVFAEESEDPRKKYKREWIARRRAEEKADRTKFVELHLGRDRYQLLFWMRPKRQSMENFLLALIDEAVAARKR